jgi:steroid delta-isomerase-like uncharacterized protein
MSDHTSDSVAQRFADEWNKGNLEGAIALFDDNYIDHNAAPGQKPGKAGLRESLDMFMTAFPDLKLEHSHVTMEGDRVADHGIARGTHRGNFLGVAPTGKRVEVSYTDIYRVKNGKITEAWHIEDIPGLMRQIGAMPDPTQAH